MKEMNEIKLPKGVESISVKQHDDRIVIEFIPKKPKFKAGDKVRIKDGISSKTSRGIYPLFTEPMDEFIGKKLTVEKYSSMGFVITDADYFGYNFAEDWLEPWSDELKKGDLAIFWQFDKTQAVVRLCDNEQGDVFQTPFYVDNTGHWWANAIKFESKEQFEKVLRGEI